MSQYKEADDKRKQELDRKLKRLDKFLLKRGIEVITQKRKMG